ncbi:DNA gyrase subunit A [Bacteroidetes/Chlorobi group bacterium Naka2016]|jgi:DNA gyrase subunit A|nr:MAG: DNA gyrase subunit A [Bacteroidetes/Chlorobi group bacterium Naka2016]
MEEIFKDKIVETIFEDEIKTSYLDYSMSVIVSRALPDVRDGLKPVHRRILYAMNELGLTPNRPYRKSARIVGEVLGKYHPHGDAAVYDSMVRMAQPWAMRYPLVDGQGNFGSIDGDSPAAMRYTEARLSWIAMETLRDIDKDTVDFRPNFDDSLKEPVVLPTVLPTLLVNGSSGIAVGMATNIPPHNLGEIVDGLIAVINNPDISVEELLKFVPAPDFPTGGIIYGYEGVKDAYLTGKGKIIIRSKAIIDKNSIIIKEIPYQVSKSTLIERIAELVKNKVIDDITDIRDESDRDGIRIVIELKREANPEVVLNNLFKHSQLQVTYGAIMLALVDGRPKILNLLELMKLFIEHRNEVIVRRTKFDLDAAEKRLHILEGFLIALNNLDEIIELIKTSPDPKSASDRLQARFGLSEIQAKAILDLRLQRLTNLEQTKIRQEYQEVSGKIEELKAILASKEIQLNIIADELLELKRKYNDERRTQIVYEARDFSVEDIIANEEVIVTLSHNGYIKRMPISMYRRQGKGGRGVTGAKTTEDDFIEYVFKAKTHFDLLFFTDKGKCYKVKVYDIPEGSRQSKGRSLSNIISKEPDEKVTAFLPVESFEEKKFVVMITKNGIIKKTDLINFANVRSNGIIAINLQENDKLVVVRLTDGNSEILIGTKNGLACRFKEEEVRSMGRTATGVRAITLDDDDQVVSMITTNDPENTQVLVVGENGFGKRTMLTEFRLTHRGAKGVISMKVTEKTGKVIGIVKVTDNDDLFVVTSKGIIIRQPIHQIRLIGRNTQGVRLIKLEPGDNIADITAVPIESNESDQTDNGQEVSLI